jgi:hypothetical protein
MNILRSINYIYPDLEFGKDFEVIDYSDWKWPYIKWHNDIIPQPTQAELETAWEQVQIELQKEEENKHTKEKIEKVLYPYLLLSIKSWWIIKNWNLNKLNLILDKVWITQEQIDNYLLELEKNL